MRTGASPVQFSREQAEQLVMLHDRLELAPLVDSPFSTTRMFQELALSGALDNLPSPASCLPLTELISAESPFMRGRQHLVEAIRVAQQMQEHALNDHVATESPNRPAQERPRG